MPDIRIVPGNAIMSFTSSLNFIERITQDPSGSLNLYGSGSTGRTELLSVDGNNGRLFTVSDDLSDSLFSVNTIAGLPVIEAFANNTVTIGQYGQNVLVVTGSRVGIGTNTPEQALHIATGSLLFTSSSANDINVRLSPGGGSGNVDHYLDVFTGGSRVVRMGIDSFDMTEYNTGLTVTGRVNLRASALGSAATQILVFNGDPSSTTRGIFTRTPAQLRSDIGAGVGSVTSIATNNGVTGGTITSTGTIGLATAYGDTVNPYASKTANNFLAAPNGSSGTPSFRAIAAADIPTLNQNTTGTATNATNVAITTQDTTPVNYNLTFVGGTSGNNPLNVDSTTLTYNPSTSIFTTPNISATSVVASSGISSTTLNIAGNGSSADAYGTVAVTEPANTANYSYYGLTRAASIGAGFGITGTNGALGLGQNAYWFGTATSGFAGVMGTPWLAFNGSSFVTAGPVTANGVLLTGNTGTVTGSGTVNYLPKWNTTTNLTNSLIFDNGTTVNINGTTNLYGERLNITGNTLSSTINSYSPLQVFQLSNGNNEYFEFGSLRTSTGNDWTHAGFRIQEKIDSTWMGYMQFNGTGNNGGISFGAGTSSTSRQAIAERMRITESGNIGINVTSPGTRLHIEDVTKTLTGNVAGVAQGTLSLVSTDAQAADIGASLLFGGNYINSNSNRIAYAAITGRKANGTSVNADGYLSFLTWRSSGLTEAMRISANGDVSVGTATPLLNTTGRGNITINGSSQSILTLGVNGVYSGYLYSASDRVELSSNTQPITFVTNGGERLRITAGGAMGLGVTPTNTAGRFEASNDIVAYSSSDKNWKNNIKNIHSPLQKIAQINGVEFDWVEDEPVHGNKGHDVGVIAQEIELILPEAVQTRESGMKAVQYDKIIPLLIESIKEQQKQIEELKQIVNGLTR